jgi:hypothetical protein
MLRTPVKPFEPASQPMLRAKRRAPEPVEDLRLPLVLAEEFSGSPAAEGTSAAGGNRHATGGQAAPPD